MTFTIQGVEVPALGLGTWQLSGHACVEAVEHALSLGYRHLDTAQNYGNEREVGEGLKRSSVDREEIFLVTKVSPGNFARQATLRSVRESLVELGTDYVDLLLMHWPNPRVPLEETLGAMLELQERGAVRHLGVSNFPPSLVEDAQRLAPIFCNQVEFHPYQPQDELLAQAKRMDYLLTAYSPLAKGRVMRDPTLREIGDAHGKTPAQVTLRWLLQTGAAVIPKAASADHQESNLKIFDFELSDEEMRAVSSLRR